MASRERGTGKGKGCHVGINGNGNSNDNLQEMSEEERNNSDSHNSLKDDDDSNSLEDYDNSHHGHPADNSLKDDDGHLSDNTFKHHVHHVALHGNKNSTGNETKLDDNFSHFHWLSYMDWERERFSTYPYMVTKFDRKHLLIISVIFIGFRKWTAVERFSTTTLS